MNNIKIYKDGDVNLEISLEDDTIWLQQAELSELFDKNQSVISRHINNIFNDNEVDKKSNMQKKDMDNIIRATPNLYKKRELIEEFIAIYKASNGTIENIEQEYAKYSDDKKHKAIIDFCARHKIDTDKTLHLIGKYIYDSKDIKSDTIADLFIEKLKFMDRVKKVPVVHTELMELIYKFESV